MGCSQIELKKNVGTSHLKRFCRTAPAVVGRVGRRNVSVLVWREKKKDEMKRWDGDLGRNANEKSELWSFRVSALCFGHWGL